MKYIKVTFSVPEDFADILIAELNEFHYDSFAAEGDQLDAYVVKEYFDERCLQDLVLKYKELIPVGYTFEDLEDKNWNEEWEKNFDPVRIANCCMIRASFHEQDPDYPLEIVINPKMSFGTGHHETTSLMIENQLNIDHKDKVIMDAGSGTGILAILAEKLGAYSVDAFDIEDWAFNNMEENVQLNNCSTISVKQGTIETLDLREQYDILLANINKNVLLEEMPHYAGKLKKGGMLLLSGFYKTDQEDISVKAGSYKLKLEKESYKNNWACLVFSKL